MLDPPLYCPLCGYELDGVDLERRPQGVRCCNCGQGWEVIGFGDKVLVSQANSFSRPKLKVHVPPKRTPRKRKA